MPSRYMAREWGRVIQTEVKRLARPTPGAEGDPGRGREVGRGKGWWTGEKSVKSPIRCANTMPVPDEA